MKPAQITPFCLVAIAAVLSLFSARASSHPTGNFTLIAGGSETGDLTVQGEAHIAGDLDFGTTGTNQSAALLHYAESGTAYVLELTATRPGTAFIWQDNGAFAMASKMRLSADNTLSLFDAAGACGISLSPNTGMIALAGIGSGIRLSDGTVLRNAASLRVSALFNSAGTAAATVTSEGKINFPMGISLGSNNSNSGANSFASGNNTRATGISSSAFGHNATASGWASAALGYNAAAAGFGSTAFGDTTSASADRATAFGCYTKASGYGSTAFGDGAKASGARSTAFGYMTSASEFGSTAFGDSTKASGIRSTAFGESTSASGYASTALGCGTKASGRHSTAVGEYTEAQSYCSIVLGRFNITQGNSTAWTPSDDLLVVGNGDSSTTRSNAFVVKKNGDTVVSGNLTLSDGTILLNAASLRSSALFDSSGTAAASVTMEGKVHFANGITLGTANVASGANSLANGNNSTAAGTNAIALGESTMASGWCSAAFGDSTSSSADRSTAFGYATAASEYASTAFGDGTTASGVRSTAFGYATIASGYVSTALGDGTMASGVRSTAFGYATIASGYASTAFGESSAASGVGSLAFGFQTTASGDSSTAFGENATASGVASTAFGYGTEAAGSLSIAFGDSAKAAGVISAAFGQTVAQPYYSLALGRFNIAQGDSTKWIPTDDLFVIGNGDSDDARANAFVVKKNGDTTISGKIEVAGRSKIQIEPQGDLSMGDFTAE